MGTPLSFDSDGVLAEDPRGLKVMLPAPERASGLLIGDVVGWHTGRNILTGKTDTWLKVRHFNGEAWPFQPRAQDVEVIR
jgi:hypothetical protein